MTDITIFGGTGYVGGNIAREAAGRGHSVTSISPNTPGEARADVNYRSGSIHDADVVAAAMEDDVVVVAVRAFVDGGPQLSEALPELISAAVSNGTRLGFVGGAGSSLVAEGGPRLVDTPDFREEWKPEATAHAAVLDSLREAPPELDWLYVSPAAVFGSFAPGETTGAYRIGGDVLVADAAGNSEISGTDYALAFVDEIDRPAHRRQRFTVGH